MVINAAESFNSPQVAKKYSVKKFKVGKWSHHPAESLGDHHSNYICLFWTVTNCLITHNFILFLLFLWYK